MLYRCDQWISGALGEAAVSCKNLLCRHAFCSHNSSDIGAEESTAKAQEQPIRLLQGQLVARSTSFRSAAVHVHLEQVSRPEPEKHHHREQQGQHHSVTGHVAWRLRGCGRLLAWQLPFLWPNRAICEHLWWVVAARSGFEVVVARELVVSGAGSSGFGHGRQRKLRGMR